MKTVRAILAAALVVGVAVSLLSCGGGTTLLPGQDNGHQRQPGPPGSVTISVNWPESSARIIPAGTDRLMVHVFYNGDEIVRPDLPLELVRDPSGGLATAVIGDLPVGTVLISVFAYSDDAPDVPLASATNVQVDLAPGENEPVVFTLSSGVASVQLTPDSADLLPGEPCLFTASALDDQGQVILGIEFSFALLNGDYVTLTPDPSSDNSATVQAIRPGSGAVLEAKPTNDPDPAHAAQAPITSQSVWVVSTFAGTGEEGMADGDALTEAQFGTVFDTAVGDDGSVYVTDWWNARVCRIADGQVTTIAAAPLDVTSRVIETATPDIFYSATGVDVDSQGNVYFTDGVGNRVFKISGGQVSLLAGTGEPGYADGDALTEAQFWYPYGIAVDDLGNVFVSDSGNGCIRLISGGVVTTFAGVPWQPPFGAPSSERLFPRPGASAPVQSRQEIPEYTYLNGPADQAMFFFPVNIELDNQGNLYVADMYNNVIRVVSNGQVSTLAGSWYAIYFGQVSSKQYGWPVLDGSAATATFAMPAGVTVGPDGEVYVAEYAGCRIRRIQDGYVTTIAGTGEWGYADGLGLEATFYWPLGLAADRLGNVYVADPGNSVVRKVSPHRYGEEIPTPRPTPTYSPAAPNR